MGDMATFSPELKRLYLSKRKQVGVLASENWKHKFPKFNTPERKAELEQFAKKISDECSLPEAGFFSDGIAQHIKSFFSEQRRFQKTKEKFAVSPSPSESSSSSEVEFTPRPKLPSMPKENRGKMLSPDNSEGEDELSSTDTVILNLDNDLSGNEPDEACEESLSAEPASVNKITKKSAMVVVKAVTGKIPEREELVKMLKRRFEVPSKSLTALKVSQILEVTARKLITLKYVSLKNGTSSGDIRKSDINVHREIDMLNLE